MRNADKYNPPIQYSWLWLLIGCGLLLVVLLWYGFVFWYTRRKKPKQMDDLKQLAAPDLNQLKAKYLQLIEDLYQAYLRHEIDLRVLHQELSMAVRSFVQEAGYLPAPYLTLADLRQSPYRSLTALIESYYPEEFAAITHGDAAAATQAAKGVVSQWPY